MINEDNSESLDTIRELNSLISECQKLQKIEVLEDKVFLLYKGRCDDIFKKLVNAELTTTISEIALSGVNLKVKEVRNPVMKFLVSFFNYKPAITFNAPFLTKHSRSDNLKKHVFWTEMKLKGLLFNLAKVE